MSSMLLRPYRKNLTTHGLIYLADEEQQITIKNISITGVLAQLNSKVGKNDIKDIFNTLLASTIIDLYLPEMRLAGEVEVIRVDLQDDHILLALEFKNVNYDVNDLLYKRKAYRKNLPGPGHILFNGEYLEFNAINVSVDGIMIRLAVAVYVEPGVVTVFEFKQLELEGEIKVIWVDRLADGGTIMGLQYVHMEKSSIKGIPQFAWPRTA
ncbi:MAG: PilZ domain-containing protein [Methyloglobulus sp.]|nr:PilZ domain-containing protein [Methyloglobulus sp.]